MDLSIFRIARYLILRGPFNWVSSTFSGENQAYTEYYLVNKMYRKIEIELLP